MSLQDVLMIEKERARRERVIIQSVLERLRNRIKHTVRIGEKYCMYEIPMIIPGYPLVDIDRTMMYLLKKLRKEGFIVVPVSANTILLTWDVEDVRKLSKAGPRSSVVLGADNDKSADPGGLGAGDKDFLDSLLAAKRSARS